MDFDPKMVIVQALGAMINEAVEKKFRELVNSLGRENGPIGGTSAVYTPEQVAEIMKISVDTVRSKYCKDDPTFPVRRAGRKYLIPVDAFWKWFNKEN